MYDFLANIKCPDQTAHAHKIKPSVLHILLCYTVDIGFKIVVKKRKTVVYS